MSYPGGMMRTVQTPQRTEPPHRSGERATLAGFLEFQRETLAWKCAGLTDAQLLERPVAPSGLSLLGLVRHLAENERGWFREDLLGERLDPLWPPEADFAVDGADVAGAFAAWQAECARSRSIVERLPSLDVVGKGGYSARWIITHMIEEYARHNGHADLIRERLDGSTGE
jgi:hypothetical protein